MAKSIWKDSRVQMGVSILGWVLAITSLYQLWNTPDHYFWLAFLFVGAILMGGLPNFNKVKKVLNTAPAALMLSVGLVVFLIRTQGVEELTSTVVAFSIGVFVVGLLVAPTITALIKNK